MRRICKGFSVSFAAAGYSLLLLYRLCRGSYTFYNVIEDKQLLNEWRRAYEEERYKGAYMENAMIQLDP
jgi:hypothetical protein